MTWVLPGTKTLWVLPPWATPLLGCQHSARMQPEHRVKSKHSCSHARAWICLGGVGTGHSSLSVGGFRGLTRGALAPRSWYYRIESQGNIFRFSWPVPSPLCLLGISWDRRLTWLLGWGRIEYFSLFPLGAGAMEHRHFSDPLQSVYPSSAGFDWTLSQSNMGWVSTACWAFRLKHVS